jgi:hypothetical protein
MDKQRLLETLEDLRSELAESESVDSDTIAQLEDAVSDLQHELERRGSKSAGNVAPASKGLKDALLSFEAEHPQLSAAIGKVADALAAMGI